MATVAIVGTVASVPESRMSPMARALLDTAGALSNEFGTVQDLPRAAANGS
jgi:hypothetical protein